MRLLTPYWHRRARVLDQADGKVCVEHGQLESIGAPDRLAILAHYSQQSRVSRSFRTMARELGAHGYRVLVVSAASDPGPLDWNGDLPPDAIVLRQPNLGYDFGSWAIGLDAAGSAKKAGSVILANDSLIGPFSSLRPLLDRFERADADVWAMTDTYQYFHHLQSYFLGFRNGVLAQPPLERFWSDIRIERSKLHVIHNNELGLSRLLLAEGYQTSSAFRADDIVSHGENPVIKGWSRLMDRGFPFLKREIVRDPTVAPMSDGIAAQVALVFGEVLGDWL